LPLQRGRNRASSGNEIAPRRSAWTAAPRAESERPLPLELRPTYQISIPGFLAEPRVRIAPRLPLRRAARPREIGEAEVVVLYNLALGLERGRPEDLVSDAATARVARSIAAALQGHVRSVQLAPVWDDLGEVLRHYDPARHVVFNLCESLGGRSWSEAEVPRLMRAAGFIHTGSSYLALRRTGNKLITKRTLLAAGLQTPPFEVIRRADRRPTRLTLPAIVKPVAEHGSCGVSLASVVDDRNALGERIDECIRCYRQPALVEEFIDGRELNVALWGNGFPEVLPIAEIAFTWTDEPLQRIVISPEVALTVEAVGTLGLPGRPLPERSRIRSKRRRCSPIRRWACAASPGSIFACATGPPTSWKSTPIPILPKMPGSSVQRARQDTPTLRCCCIFFDWRLPRLHDLGSPNGLGGCAGHLAWRMPNLFSRKTGCRGGAPGGFPGRCGCQRVPLPDGR
jgi:hypothetical protein